MINSQVESVSSRICIMLMCRFEKHLPAITFSLGRGQCDEVIFVLIIYLVNLATKFVDIIHNVDASL